VNTILVGWKACLLLGSKQRLLSEVGVTASITEPQIDEFTQREGKRKGERYSKQ
jgi:hypothetical protein